MGDNGATTVGAGATGGLDKGKGKESENPQFADVSMGEEDDSSSDESAAEEQVDEDDEAAQDDLNEISEENIINSGRRTRGKVINFAEAAAKAQEAGEDLDDDDDDEDFRGQDNDGDDEMKD
ncbi:Histone H2A.Z-specific chaperone [Onygenales sp. PD_40]|nr:Histone H2A.Z-specific chaperone [Onygenales sp. PD_40]